MCTKSMAPKKHKVTHPMILSRHVLKPRSRVSVAQSVFENPPERVIFDEQGSYKLF